MSTARQLITDSLRTLAVLASGETPTAAMASDALTLLNERIEALNLEGVTVYSVQQDTDFATVGGTGAYTYGSGGDWNSTRPIFVDRLVYNDGTSDYALYELSDLEWQAIDLKTLQSSYPEGWHDDHGFPLRTIALYPVPSVVGTIKIYRWVQLSSLSTLDTAVAFPPGYQHFLRYDLARALAPEYEQPVSQLVQAQWSEGLARLRRLNTRMNPMTLDPILTRAGRMAGIGYGADILKGQP